MSCGIRAGLSKGLTKYVCFCGSWSWEGHGWAPCLSLLTDGVVLDEGGFKHPKCVSPEEEGTIGKGSFWLLAVAPVRV